MSTIFIHRVTDVKIVQREIAGSRGPIYCVDIQVEGQEYTTISLFSEQPLELANAVKPLSN